MIVVTLVFLSQAFIAVLRAAFAFGDIVPGLQLVSAARGAAASVFETINLVSDSLHMKFVPLIKVFDRNQVLIHCPMKGLNQPKTAF